LTFSTNPLFPFISLLVLFMPNFHGKIAYCCIYFSFMLYDNLFLVLSSLHKHLKPFLKFRPPPFILTLRLLNFGFFSDPPCLLGPPVYLALESSWRFIHSFYDLHCFTLFLRSLYFSQALPQMNQKLILIIIVFKHWLMIKHYQDLHNSGNQMLRNIWSLYESKRKNSDIFNW